MYKYEEQLSISFEQAQRAEGYALSLLLSNGNDIFDKAHKTRLQSAEK